MVNILKKMKQSDELVITLRHERWLTENSNPVYSSKALDFAGKVLSNEIGGSRSRNTLFRSSGLGACERHNLYKANKIKGIDTISSDLANIFATGNFLHLKWQMMGLTEGWLEVAEHPVESKEHSFGGTLDGILHDGSLFEFKTINPRGFSNVCEYGPKKDHILQAHGYMWLADLPAVSFVYEDKGSGDWREFRMKRDDEKIDEVRAIVRRMERHHREETLPEPLSKCIDKEGWQYRSCQFRNICLETK
jgi:hypothetical protein